MVNSEFNISEFFKFLKKWIALIVVLGVVFASVAFSYLCITDVKTYTSTAILSCTARVSTSENIDTATFAASEKYSETIKYMLETDTVLQKAVDLLKNNPEKAYGNISVGTLRGMIKIDQQPSTYILEVSATSSDRYVSSDVANAITEASKSVSGADGLLKVGQIEILEKAKVPEVANNSRISLKVVVAGFIGIALGLLFVFILYILDDRIKNQEDLLNKYNVPILGVIPPRNL